MSNKIELRQLIDKIKHLGGLTQAEIADEAGYKRTYLSQALNMENPPVKLITKLNLTFSDILERNTPPKKDGLESPKNGLRIEIRDYIKEKDEHIALLRKENARLQKEVEFNLTELDQRTKVIAEVQRAMMEMLLAQAGDRKAVYSKCVEILKKYELTGSFL